MKLRLDRKGLSPLVAVIVLLTLVMVLGAIIAGTLSGAPRPVLPATTAVNLMTPYGGNPAAGDNVLIIRHEYGQTIDDAWTYMTAEAVAYAESVDVNEGFYWCEMRLLVNGEEVNPLMSTVSKTTSNGAEVTLAYLDSISHDLVDMLTLGFPVCDAGEYVKDFALGDQLVVELSKELQSSDLVQLVYVPRDLMLVEYLVQ